MDEKEIFSEEKRAEARESIKEKLRKIAEQQERQEGEAKHNPGDFAFTKYHRMDTKP